jgi:putative colanic acid biosysnthesis UDP-glucose lipid carrier transferase
MTKSYYLHTTLRCVIDALLLTVSFSAALYVFPAWHAKDEDLLSVTFILLSLGSWYISASISRLYSDLISKKFSEELTYIASTVFLHIIFLTSLLFFFRFSFIVSNTFLALYTIILIFSVSVFKYLIRKYSHHIIYKGHLRKRVVIVGATAAGVKFYETIKKYSYYGYNCVGYLDDKQSMMNGCCYLGKIADIEDILLKNSVEEVIIALPDSRHREITDCIEVCDLHAKSVRMIPDFDLYATNNTRINNIGHVPVLTLRNLPQDRVINQMIKRMFDVLFSLSFFVLFAWWALPVIAILIKLDSKGPVFFRQERWGLNNKKITCYKFRTLIHGSPEEDSKGKFLQVQPNDVRMTRLGRFLRKSNMDELPQFWNVLIGNMSIVGPRPHPTPLNIESIEKVDRYLQRHLVKPGITGMAQVNGCRGETKTPGAMQKRVNFDLYYIHQWTFWLDCQIILQTIINFFRGDQNAY